MKRTSALLIAAITSITSLSTLSAGDPFHDYERTENIIKQIHTDRAAKTKAELQIFATESLPTGNAMAAREAIRILAELRTPGAVAPLLKQIQWFPERGRRAATIHRLEDYEVATTLVAIGMPSVEAIAKGLPAEEDPLRAALMCRVIREVLGSDLSTPFIDQLLAAETDGKNRDRLATARAWITGETPMPGSSPDIARIPLRTTNMIDWNIKLARNDRVLQAGWEARQMMKNSGKRADLNAMLEATRVLMELREPTAVDSLLEGLDWERINDVAGSAFHGKLDEFSASNALIAIGMPSVRAAGERLAGESDISRRALLCHVIRTVLGRDLGLVYVDSLLAGTHDETGRERLNECRSRVMDEQKYPTW